MTIVEPPARRRTRPGKVAILRAAVSVMGEVGYEGASMRDIAARAGVSPAAIYHHFPSKQDMLREFLVQAWDVALARIDRRLAESGAQTPPERLDVVVATLVASQHHDEYAQLASLVATREHIRLRPEDRVVVEQQQQRLLRLLAALLEAGAATGEFAVSDPIETGRAIVALTSHAALTGPDADHPMPRMIETAQLFVHNLIGLEHHPSAASEPR